MKWKKSLRFTTRGFLNDDTQQQTNEREREQKKSQLWEYKNI